MSRLRKSGQGWRACRKKEEERLKAQTFEREQAQREKEKKLDIRRLQAEGRIKTPEEKEAEAEKEAGEKFLEEKGFEEEKFPERVELDIERKGLEEKPIVGPSWAAVKNVFANAVPKLRKENIKRLRISEEEYDKIFGRPGVPALIQDPETARELVLQAIQRKESEVGTSESEEFGAIIESVKLSKIAGWLGGSVEAPAENVKTVLSEIKDSRGRVLKDYEAVRAGLMDPYILYESIQNEEENLYKLEQRIHNLSLESAELIADADTLNLVESKILRAKRVMFYARKATAIAIRGEPTNAAIDAWLMSEMKAIGEEE